MTPEKKELMFISLTLQLWSKNSKSPVETTGKSPGKIWLYWNIHLTVSRSKRRTDLEGNQPLVINPHILVQRNSRTQDINILQIVLCLWQHRHSQNTETHHIFFSTFLDPCCIERWTNVTFKVSGFQVYHTC